MCLLKEIVCKFCKVNYSEDVLARIERIGVDPNFGNVYNNCYAIVLNFHKRGECLET